MTTMEVEETGMPGGIQRSEGKGKGTEVPRTDPIRSDPFGESFYDKPKPGGSSGGSGPDPTTGMVIPSPATKKRHIQKPENFTDPRDWDKFKRQEFLYVQEYEDDFTTHAS
jgi:hypothetical protein